MPTARKRKPKPVKKATRKRVTQGISRKTTDRYIERSVEPFTGMKITARIHRFNDDPEQFSFDGTLPDKFLRKAELVGWMNQCRMLMEAAAEDRASLKK